MSVGNVHLQIAGNSIPVHKATVRMEAITENKSVVSDCHSIVIRNTGTNPVEINGQPFEKGELYYFHPPKLNVIDTTVYDVKFRELGGSNEVWITRSIIDFCFD
jgi:hypothetical protein